MSGGKKRDKNHTIENVVTILAASTMIFFLMILPAYGHGGRLDANGGHTNSETGEYHVHRTPKEMSIELMKESSDEEVEAAVEAVVKAALEAAVDKKSSDDQKKAAVKAALEAAVDKKSSDEKVEAVVEAAVDKKSSDDQKKAAVKAAVEAAVKAAVDKKSSDDEKKQESKQISKFLDAGFGLGVGLLHGLGTKNVSATLDENGIVTVVEDKTRAIDLLLEVHYYPQQWRRLKGNFAHGPFVFLNTGAIDTDAETLRTLGIGWMMGVRVAGDKSINIGLAYALKRGVQSLRNDFVAGQKAPSDDMGNFTEPQYTKSTEGAWVVLVSFAAF